MTETPHIPCDVPGCRRLSRRWFNGAIYCRQCFDALEPQAKAKKPAKTKAKK